MKNQTTDPLRERASIAAGILRAALDEPQAAADANTADKKKLAAMAGEIARLDETLDGSSPDASIRLAGLRDCHERLTKKFERDAQQ